MTTMHSLLNTLARHNIRLGLTESDNIKIRGNKDRLTQDILVAIKNHKLSLIDWLKKSQPFALLSKEERNKLDLNLFEDAYPLSALQAGMVFHSELSQFSGVYHDINVELIRYQWHRPYFEKALASCIQRHPILRTSYIVDDQRPLQFVNRDFSLPLEVIDLKSINHQQEYLQQWLDKEKKHKFNWQSDPLFSVRIFLLDDSTFYYVLSFHHSILDGWSRVSFNAELYRLYYGFLNEESLEQSKETDWTYKDYIVLEQIALNDESAQLHFQENLLHAPTQQIPTKKHNPQDAFQKVVQLKNFEEISPKLLIIAQALGIPIQTVLLTVQLKVLSFISGQNIAMSCITINGRPEQYGAEDSLGLFLNSLPLSVEISNCSWRELILNVAKQYQQVIEYRRYPYAAIQQITGSVFSEVSLNYTHFHKMAEASNDLEKVGLEVISSSGFEQTNFALVVNVNKAPETDHMSINFVFDENIFDMTLIQQMSDYYLRVCQSMISDINGNHVDAILLTQVEKDTLITMSIGPKIHYPRDQPIQQLFESQAITHPDQIAVIYQQQQLSYAELNRQSNQLAHYLQEQGVGSDVLVGLFLHRSVEMVLAILAVLKAGGAYVPVDPEYPQARIDFMLQDTKVEQVLTQQHLSEQLSDSDVALLVLDAPQVQQQLAELSTENPLTTGTSKDLAYVIYTSGSTGQPKGVAIEHQALMNRIDWMQKAYQLKTQDRVLQKTPYSFDVSVWEFIWTLGYGATLVLAKSEGHKDPQYLQQLINQHSVSIIHFVPSMLRAYLQANGAELPSSLRHVICSGEALGLHESQRLQQHSPHVGLINLYGPTEATIDVSHFDCTQLNQHSSVPIGQAIQNTQLLVLNDHLQLTPQGCTGELYIGGDNLARGYLNRPELTAQRFIDDPFNTVGRLYRTGDVVRYDAEGQLYYEGRVDDQVKIRGFRIELGEIEACLMVHEEVQAAVVLVTDQQQLVAYVQCQSETQLNDLKNTLPAQLPAYMVPKVMIRIDEVPMSANGKVNKQALPAIEIDSSTYVAPVGDAEQKMVQIWSELLKIDADHLSREANFFELGGHSLLSIRLMAKIRKYFAIDLTIKTVFDFPTLQLLTSFVDKTDKHLNRPDIVSVDKSKQGLPLSYAQQRLWFVDQMNGGSSEYNMPGALSINGPFEPTVAEIAIKRIIDRHEVLRTIFKQHDGHVTQNIQSDYQFNITIHDLSDLDETLQKNRIEMLRHNDAFKAFDLSKDLMVRVSYIKCRLDHGILIFNMHHIASDGWSQGLLIKEFVTQYKASYAGEPDPLSPLSIQYADYAYWQRQWLDDEFLSDQLAYWQKQLADVPVSHSLPLDVHRPKERTHRGGMVNQKLSGSLSQSLMQLSQQHDVTLFMLMHACISFVIGKYSSSEDVVIGTPMANRLHVELEPLIGFFINTVVLRTTVSDTSLADYLKHVKEVNLGAQANQDVPFDQIIEQCEITRVAGQLPLAEIQFSMNNTLDHQLQINDLSFSTLADQNVVARFDLNISAEVIDDVIHLQWLYDSSVFTQQWIDEISQSLLNVIDYVVENPATQLKDIPLLTPAEYQRILIDLNNTDQTFADDLLIHEAFEKQLNESPESTAVHWQGKSYSYQTVNQKANQLAHYLIDQGVMPGEYVGLYIDRSFSMIIGIMAILKAGACYTPLDVNLPGNRFEHIIEDAQITHMMTSSQWMSHMDLSDQKIILLDDQFFPVLYDQFSTETPIIDLDASKPAYVIYTSGSTGKPKGTILTHRGAHNLALAQIDAFVVSECSRVLQFASISFDASISEWLMALLSGAALHICSDEQKKSLHELKTLLIDEKITHATIPPALMEHLEYSTEYAFEALIMAGESCSQNVLELWSQSYKIFNAYGPTETTVCASIGELTTNSTIHIGKPIANTRVYVLDQMLNPVPFKSIGELYVSGAGIALGYLNQEQLMVEKFLPNPFVTESQVQYKKMYRTGDLVRYIEGDNLQFVGRTDDQVKIRGHRIELGEIEQQLMKLVSVKASLVMVNHNENLDKQLIAYVLTDEQQESSDEKLINQLKTYLTHHLPEYMLPVAYVVLTAWPLNQNGKIDKHALPIPDLLTLSAYIKPVGDTALTLVKTWSELLNIEEQVLGQNANFFELGGHSLLAVRLVAEIREKLGKELPVKEIFEFTQLQHLADHIDESKASNLRSKITSIERYGDTYPMSFAQQRLWFIDTLQQGSIQYNMPLALRVEGNFDSTHAELAIKKIIDRHETLRTTFKQSKEGPVQVINRHYDFTITTHDLRPYEALKQQNLVQELIEKDAHQAFDLSQDLMIRVNYLQLSDHGNNASNILLLNMHHIASDAWSMGVLIKEFSQFYIHINTNEKTNDLRDLDIQYIDYTMWQKQWINSESAHLQKLYWQQQLHDIPATHQIPLCYQRPKHKKFAAKIITTEVTDTLLKKLIKLSNKQNLTLFMLLHAALTLVIARNSNQQEVVIGTPVANRLQSSLSPLIGFFINTLLLRANINHDDTLAFLQHIKYINLQAQENQDIPFDHLVELSDVPRSTSYTPLFQILFNMDNTSSIDLNIPGLSFSILENENTTVKFDLNVNAQHSNNKLMIHWTYDVALFTQKKVEMMSQHMINVLHSITEDITQSPVQIDILTQKEQRYLIKELNDTACTYPDQKMLLTLFQEQSAKKANNVVAVHNNQAMTYASLNQSAQRLANHLISLGLTPRSRVAICLHRSHDLLIAIIAVLKSSASYVMLNPSDPLNRKKFILNDAKVSFVLLNDNSTINLVEDSIYQVNISGAANDDQWMKNYPHSDPKLSVSIEDEMYVLYTSGTTGKPKGVMVSHQSVIDYCQHAFNAYYSAHLSGALLLTSPLFDISVPALFLPLMSGDCIHLPNDDVLDASAEFLQATDQNLLLRLTPMQLQALLELLPAQDLSHSHVFVIGGEQLSAQLVAELNLRFPKAQIYNHYGPTEATIGSSLYDVTLHQKHLPSIIPIGTAMANTELYVLSQQQALLPYGVAGELYIGGQGLANGYVNQPELTNINFIDHPFKKGHKLYKTGDIVRYNPTGELEFIERLDNQVKLRGYRIELAEIESCLMQHDKVDAAIAVITSEHQQLVAYVLCESEELLVDLKLMLEQHLPIYMVPSILMRIDEVPLSASGKIDKKSLPILKKVMNVYKAPVGPLEQQMAQIWSDLLKLDIDDVSRDANFFELGGHSLLSIRLVSEARSLLGLELNIRDVFDQSTLQQLCDKLANKGGDLMSPGITVVERNSEGMPVSFAQQRLWFIDQMDSGSAQYNMPGALSIEGNFDPLIAEQAIARIIDRHEVLRTTFSQLNDQSLQHVQSNYEFKLNSHDLTSLSEQQQLRQVDELLKSDSSRIFDLNRDLMIRASHIMLSNQHCVMLFNIHHIASDGWSQSLLINEFVNHYQSIKLGNHDSMQALPIQYVDYAYWQRQWLTDEVLADQLDYWKTQLADAPATHSLPLDYSRPESKQYNGEVVSGFVEARLTKKLIELANEHQLTPFMLLHAAIGLLIARHGNNNDVIIGTPVANRMHKELEDLIGFFVNTLALRTKVNHNNLSDYLADIKRINVEAQANQDLPFENLVDQLKINRSIQHTPIFQIVLTMNNTESSDLDLPNMQFTLMDRVSVAARVDLEISAKISPAGISLAWNYDTSIFKRQRIEQLNDHLLNIIKAMTKFPNVNLADIKMLCNDEYTHLVEELNPGVVKSSDSQLFLQAFEKIVQLHKHSVAARYEDTVLTYVRLNQLSNRLAHYLQDSGIEAGDRVGLYLDRSLSMLVAVLAVMKSGGSYVALEPGQPVGRLAHVMSDADIQMVLLNANLLDSLPLDGIDVMLMDEAIDDQRWLSEFADVDLNVTNQAHDEVYVLYTSGSTGQPKGVSITHGGLSHYLQHAQGYMPSPVTGSVVSSPLCFDATITSLLTPLLLGGEVELLADDENILNVLNDRLFNSRTSLLFKLTPSHLEALSYQDDTTSSDLCHHVVIGGEALKTSTLSKWKANHLPQATFYNEYGPTETVVGCCVFRIDADTDLTITSEAVPIGRPIDNIQLYILGHMGELQAHGSIGELYIAGAGVSLGYVNQPEATKERFIDNPFGEGKLYKTGDLVHYQSDDNLMFVSRLDDQVKLRGYRIELGEIESCLMSHELVNGAIAMVNKDESGIRQLMTYVILEAGELHQNLQALKDHLSAHLPEYMLPSVWIELDAIPLTVNGKLDKKALSKAKGMFLGVAYSAPETAIEQKLVKIWSSLLKLKAETISTSANFFELGGDSILSIQAVSRSASEGMYFTVKDLFKAQNIHNLSKVVKDEKIIKAPQHLINGEMKLLPIQKKFFSNDKDVNHYNQSVLLETSVHFKADALQEIFAEIYKKHDALRLYFQKGNSDTWVANYGSLDTTLVKKSIVYKHLDKQSFEGLTTIANELHQSLNLQKGQLFKVAYITNDVINGTGRLLLIFHHLIIDGVSWRIILDDLQKLYKQHISDSLLTLTAKTSSYQQWSDALYVNNNRSIYNAEKTFWQEQYSTDVKPLNHAYLTNNKDYSYCATVSFTIGQSMTESLLVEANKPYKTNIDELLLAALLLTWHNFNGTDAIRVDMESHGRDSIDEQMDLSETVGWFTSIYPILLRLPQENNVHEIICAVKEKYRQIKNNGLAFGVLKYIDEDKKVANLPDCEMVFNYLGQVDQVVEENDLFNIAKESTGDNTSRNRPPFHALSLSGLILNHELNFNLSFDDAKYDVTKIEAFMLEMKDSLVNVINHCTQQIKTHHTPSDFPLAHISQQELNRWVNVPELAIEDVFPATGMQQGLLFDTLLKSGSYVTQTSVHFDVLNVDCFKKAWQKIVNRHCIFRCSFIGQQSGNAHQLVHTNVQLPWIIHDLSRVDETLIDNKIRTIIQNDKLIDFDFSVAPLMRMTIIKLKNDGIQFVWSTHHALLDGWCKQIIFSELITYYHNILNKKDHELKPVAEYRNYIQWLIKQDKEQAKNYWKQQLSEFNGPTPLPLISHHVENNKQGVNHVIMQLSKNNTQKLIDLAQSNQTTVNVICQAAWSLLLSRYCGEEKIIFGSISSGRSPEVKDVEDIIGLFINTLPVFVNVNGDIKIKAWLHELHQQLVERESFSYLPLNEIHSLKDNNRNIFNSLMAFENYPTDEAIEKNIVETGISIKDIQTHEETNYDITLILQLTDQLGIEFQTQKNKLSLCESQIIMTHYQQILLNLIENDTALVKQISMLNAAEVNHLLYELNDTTVDYPDDLLMHELFIKQFIASPQSVAVIDSNGSMTYQDLFNATYDLYGQLNELNLSKEELVAVYVGKGRYQVICTLAIMMTGAAYLPLSLSWPKSRCGKVMEQGGCRYYLCTSDESLECDDGDFQAYFCDDVSESSRSTDESIELAHSYRHQIKPEDLAYVIFTSGSTGLPKGVAIEHGSAVNTLLDINSQYEIGAEDKVLVVSALSFDLSVYDIFGLLAAGGCCVFPDEDKAIDPQHWLELIEHHAVTIWDTVPASAGLLVDELEQADRLSSAPLRHILMSGDWIPLDLPDRLTRRFSGVSLHSLGGATEGSIWSIHYPICTVEDDWTSIPYGKPLSNQSFYVLDEHMRLVPKGTPGQLYIGGKGVARCYYNDQQRSESHFMVHPEYGLKLYRTGDYGRYLPDGNLEFLGRVDDQVKIHGFRIELGEIESCLMSHDEVKHAFAVVKDQHRLVAYVMCKSDENLAKLENSLQQQLPSYMIPSVLMRIDQVPLSANGKVDKKALPEPIFSEQQHVPLVGEAEQQMASIWANLLKIEIENIGRDADFFDLGGHSLLSIRLVAQIREHFQADLSIKDVFEQSTLRDLCAISDDEGYKATILKIKPVTRLAEGMPLSYAQQRLWFIDQMEGGSAQYNMFGALSVYGDFDPDIAEIAIDRILSRHEVLRTVFAQHDGQPVQIVKGQYDFIIHRHDISELSELEQSQRIQQLMIDEGQHIFDLSQDLMVRVSYIWQSKEEGILMFNMHHIASDGWSQGIMIDEFLSQYKALKSGQCKPLDALAIQYVDYAFWQRQWLTESLLDKQLSYWKKNLADAPIVHSLPLDFVRPETKRYHGAIVRGHIGTQLFKSLMNLASTHQLTPFMLLHAAMALLIGRHGNNDDVIIGTSVANRMHKELEPLMGFFVNGMALRVNTQDQELSEYFQHVKTINIEAQANQDLPFEHLVDQLKINRSVQYTPVYQIMMTINNTEKSDISLDGITFSDQARTHIPARVDLEISAHINDNGIDFSWTYDASIFSETHVQQLNTHFINVLGSMAIKQKSRLSQIAMLGNEESDHLLHALNGIQEPRQYENLFLQLFKKSVASHPDAIAVQQQKQKLTYEQIDQLSHRLACYLQESGVEKGERVGIYLSRSPIMLVAILGVMKSAASYVALDTVMPNERMSHIINDADLEMVLLTTNMLDDIPLSGVDVLLMDEAITNDQWLSEFSDENLQHQPHANDEVYVLYTSGSTGQPKGVAINHKGLANYLTHAQKYMTKSTLCSVVSSPLCFDATLTSLLTPLTLAKKVVLLKDDEHLLDELSEHLFNRNEPCLFKLTPAHLQALSYHSQSAQTHVAHQVVLGGESLNTALLTQWRSLHLPQAIFYNEYGPTETVVGCCVYQIHPTTDLSNYINDSVPIGRPIHNCQLYVVGDHGQLQPHGSHGELWISGDGLSDGYVNQTKKTAERFIDNPFASGKVYKSGDVVRFGADGLLHFLGRCDDQIKLRGYRIELGEIESCLNQHESVHNVLMMLREDEAQNQQLVAYVVLSSGHQHTSVDDMKDHVHKHLPSYMMPSAWVILEAMPLSINGKIDKKALPSAEGAYISTKYVAPETETEQNLVDMWSTLLKVPANDISIIAGFFELGGHSLLLIRMVAMVESELGVKLDLHQAYLNSTIRELSESVDHFQFFSDFNEQKNNEFEQVEF